MKHNSPKPSNIYIVGAQCTGKTTLVRALAEHFAKSQDTCNDSGSAPSTPTILTEVARSVLKKHNYTADDIAFSPIRALELQRLILEAQAEAEDAIDSRWFICDRSGFDPIVYARRYVGDKAADELLESDAFIELKDRMQQALVVVCEAGADWLKDDGVRLMPESKKDWVGFHRLFCASLEDAAIRHVVLPCTTTDLTERLDFVLQKWRETEK
ncbi:hypothetical protein MMC20_006505 [Loxospora ochrophaea]|nr:hypothetical protein [Loxospora ochrophaea]